MRDGKVLFIANPAAQHGNGARIAEIAKGLLEDWLGSDRVDYVQTEQPRHAVEIASHAPAERYGALIALGGDGLVHEVVNGLTQLPDGNRPAFGLIPAGSGNDFAATVGMSTCVPDAVVQFLDASEVPFDVGCCNGVYFAETLSFGLDAAIALDTVKRRKRTGQQGTRLYLASGIDQLLHHLDTYHYKAVLDDRRLLEGDMHMFAVQNGPTYGGGFRICPEADPTDGLLDLCYAEAPMNVPVATFKFLRAKNAHHTKFKNVHFERASTIDLEFDTRPPCQVDGEEFLADKFSISLYHNALKVLCPHGAG